MLSVSIHLDRNIIIVIICILITCLDSSAYSQINWKIYNIISVLFTDIFRPVCRTVINDNIIKSFCFFLNRFYCF